MERWAKTLNQKKDNARQNMTLVSAVLPSSKSIGAADAGYAVLERKDRPFLDFQVTPFDEPSEKQTDPPSPQVELIHMFEHSGNINVYFEKPVNAFQSS